MYEDYLEVMQGECLKSLSPEIPNRRFAVLALVVDYYSRLMPIARSCQAYYLSGCVYLSFDGECFLRVKVRFLKNRRVKFGVDQAWLSARVDDPAVSFAVRPYQCPPVPAQHRVEAIMETIYR